MTWEGMDSALRELDLLVEDTVDEMEADYARSGGHAPRDPNQGASGNRLQVGMWNHIIRQLGQWGVATGQSRRAARRTLRPSTLRAEQPQVRGHRPWRGRRLRGITGANHPDIQAEDPRSGRRINVEVDSTRNEGEVLSKLRRIVQQDPQARAAGVITHPRTGQAVRTHVYDPLTGLVSQHAGGLQRRDVLDLDE